MVNDKKYRNFLVIIGVLVLISIGLVAFNFFVMKNKPVEYKQYYRATRDIPAYSELTSDMFQGVTVESDVVIEGMVENIADISGQYSNGAIMQGTYLTYENMTPDNGEEGMVYTLEIAATYVADVAYGDNVDIYTLNKDNSISLLFSNKKLYKAKTGAVVDPATTETQTTAYEAASKMYIHVSNEEMIKYYTSLRDCKLIVLPYLNGALTDAQIEDLLRQQNVMEQSQQELQQNTNETEEESSVVEYTVAEGETLDMIATNFAIDKEMIVNANGGIQEVSAGQTIAIPVVEVE